MKKIMQPVTGLGDVVAKVAKPIASAIDAVAGTNLKNCGGCKKRQEKLNQAFPMKNIIAAFVLLSCLSVSARDWTYSTNLYNNLSYPTNIYMGTNSTDGTTNGDSFYQWGTKLNGFMLTYQRDYAKQSATNAFLFTNSTGGGTNAPSVSVTNVVALTNGAVPYVTNLGSSIAAVFQFGIPAGAPGTNTIAAYTFSNSILSSKEFVQYTTNYAYWNRASGGSNYLGRFQGMTRWRGYGGNDGGNDGGNPPGDIPITLYGSYSGTNSWFAITNFTFFTTNWISLAIRTNGTSYSGGTIVNPGEATVYNIDHPELYGVTNWLDYQKVKLSLPPTDGKDLVNKDYADSLFANAFNNNWSTFESNGINHFVYSYQNRIVFDITSSTVWIPLKGSSLDGPMTHILVDVYQTNLTAGYDFQSSTNLALTAGFTTFTNYVLSTNSGVVTFTVPISFAEPARFFRMVSSIASGASFNVPLAVYSGTVYPSNTWNLATITNGLNAGDIITVNSNGLKLVDVWMSNSTPVLKPHW